jgi:hypothetical protein
LYDKKEFEKQLAYEFIVSASAAKRSLNELLFLLDKKSVDDGVVIYKLCYQEAKQLMGYLSQAIALCIDEE